MWPWARGAPQYFGFPYNISATDGASDFKFGMQLEFVKAHDKITRRRKGRHGPALGVLPKIWGFPSIFTQWLKLAPSNLVHNLGLPRTTENHTQRKSRRSLGLGKLPNICGSPLIFLQRPGCPLGVSGASCYHAANINCFVQSSASGMAI